jgi:hypothetical protein
MRHPLRLDEERRHARSECVGLGFFGRKWM